MEKKANTTWTGLSWLLLWLAVLCPAFAMAQPFELSQLASPAKIQDILAGNLSVEPLVHTDPVIYQLRRGTQWWRVTASETIAPDDHPQLVLGTPFLTHVSAWLPGQSVPTEHSLFGRSADLRYATRALVIDLPQGLQRGQSVWLAVTTTAPTPMRVSIQPLSKVHTDDLAYVAWRSAVIATLLVLSLLGTTFWIGSGVRSYAYFSMMLLVASFYLIGMGGEVRYLGPISYLFEDSARLQRMLCCAGVMFFLLFQRLYLDLPKAMPRMDVLMRVLASTMAIIGVLCLIVDRTGLVLLVNLAVMSSCTAVLVASMYLAIKGQATARTMVLSWLPMSVFVAVRSMELSGYGQLFPWTTRALDAGFAIAALGLTVGATRDVLSLRQARDQASALVRQDALTGALSRLAIERGLEDTQRQFTTLSDAPYSVAFIDLDYFKQINDNHGHVIGDEFLQMIVQRIRSTLRQGDLLGRYGGDEFLLVMPATTQASAHVIAQRICDSVASQPIIINGLRIAASLSIGVAQATRGESVRQILRRADNALYISKAEGRGRVNSHLPGHKSHAPLTAPAQTQGV